jgi:hypothetical protein
VVTYGHATPYNNVHLICIHTLDVAEEVEDFKLEVEDRKELIERESPGMRYFYIIEFVMINFVIWHKK